ncbi:MAG TPA: polyprenyl diphosphate synthase [Candidatus Saccharimonadales bacterium]
MQTSDAAVPTHIGYIVDGNRRWAKKHGIPSYEGHLAGYNTIKDIVKFTTKQGVKFVSIYVFSTENWRREQEEVANLMKLSLRVFKTDLKEFIDENLRLRVLGSREGLSDSLLKAIDEAEKATAHLTGGTICICFNYGGWQEVVDATKAAIADGVSPEALTEEAIAQHLYAADVPPVDMVVRTSGEQRLSNFMLWRTAYSELLFLEKFWPEMTTDDVAAIIAEYQKRSRRFGG